MPNLISNATGDIESSEIVATGNLLVTVTGVIPVGVVKITADIGGGEVLAYSYTASDRTSLARLDVDEGTVIKAYVEGTGGYEGTNVTVSYLDLGTGIEAFIMEIETVNVGETFALPLLSTGTYDFTVDWGDATNDDITAYNDAAVTHTFYQIGKHFITITGVIKGFAFKTDSDSDKLISIKSFGSLSPESDQIFFGCINLESLSFFSPLDLSLTTSLSKTFRNCSKFDTNINNWNVSNVTSFFELFRNALVFNSDLSGWDTSSVVNMTSTFNGAALANPDLSNWDISSVNNMTTMFDGSSLSTENYDKLLISWSAQSIQDDVPFSAGTTKYTSAAVAAKDTLEAAGWIITDGGLVS